MGGFRTKINLGDNRQGIQRKGTITDLSGTTVFGTEYSALTSGVDLETVQTTSTLGNVDIRRESGVLFILGQISTTQGSTFVKVLNI